MSGLSMVGCYVESITPPHHGDRISMRLELPQGPLSLDAEVVSNEPGRGFVVRFVDLTPEAHEMLAGAIELLSGKDG